MSHDSQTATPNAAQQASPLAQVFQEAYQKAVLIKRLDDQISQISARRKALCDELRTIQSQLNDEFSKLVENDGGAAAAGIAANMPLTIAQPDFSSGNGVHVTVNPKAFNAAARSTADAAVA